MKALVATNPLPAVLVSLALVTLAGCQAMVNSNTPCTVTAIVTPATATADHTLTAPGNQVQFTTSFKTTGSCVLPQSLALGSWSTSEPANVSITAGDQPPQSAAATATCLNATTAPVTISYSGTEYGARFTSATLSCK